MSDSDRLSESVFKQLQRAILAGEYPPGSRFPAERELAARYGVGRSTVREAVGRLAKSGLVETRPQSGTYVSDYQDGASLDLLVELMQSGGEIDSDTLLSLMDARALIELRAVELAAGRFTAEDRAALAVIVEQERSAAGDTIVMADCDYRLHYLVMKRSGNIVLHLFFNSFRPVYRFYTDFFFALPGAVEATREQHRRFATAMARGSVRDSRAVMREALDYGSARVIEALGIGAEPKKIRLAVN